MLKFNLKKKMIGIHLHCILYFWLFIRSSISDNTACNDNQFVQDYCYEPSNSSCIVIRDATLEPCCNRLYILDIGFEFTSINSFETLQYFIYNASLDCLSLNIGHSITIVPLHAPEQETTCCSADDCLEKIYYLAMDDVAINYGDTAPFITGAQNILSYCENLTIAAKSQDRCGLNSIVFITNRLIEIDETGNFNLPLVFQEIFNASCSRLTIVVVGNDEITMGLLKYEYGNITSNLFVVDDYTCLGELVDCMPPCDHTKYSTCTQYQTFQCSFRVPSRAHTNTTESTDTVTPKITPTQAEWKNDTLYLLYVLILSTRITEENFTSILHFIQEPLDEYFNQVGNNISIALFSIYNETYWLDTKMELDVAFSKLTYNNVITNTETVDMKDKNTTNLVVEAISVYGKHEVPDDVFALPRIVLLSDFASENFAHAYQSQLYKDLSNFLFNVILFDQQAESYYYTNSSIPKAAIHFSNLSNLVPEPIYWLHSTTKPETKAISHLAEIFLIIGLIFAIAIIVLIVAIVIRQRAILLKKVAFFSFKNNSNDDLHLLDHWELSNDQIWVSREKLGSGAHGQVYKGKIRGKPPCIDHYYRNQIHLATRFENCDVAIKTLPKYASETAKKEFLREIELMKWIGYNDNIVNMLGCITIGEPLCLILEFMPIDLMQYLRNRRMEFENCYPTTCEEKTGLTKDFMQFAWQIADGMRYLSSKGIVHRDLAARNILVDEERNAKICDFGLCIQKSTRRTTIDLNFGPDQQNRKSGVVVAGSGRLPIKWLAIESLQRHEFSVKSDVWSYGLLLFEIYSFGEAPFSTVDTKDMLRHLEGGGRPEKPEFCSLEIYEILQDCWAEDPEERPTFQELLTKFTILLERTTESYGYLAILQDCSSDNENHTVTASSHTSKLGRIAQSFCFPMRTGNRGSSESDAENKNGQRRHTSADIKIDAVNHLTVRQKRKLERKVSSFDDYLTSCRKLSYSVNSESNPDSGK